MSLMQLSSLRESLKDSLHDSGDLLEDPDFDRCLTVAAAALGAKKPLEKLTSITVSAGVAEYAAPDDFHSFASSYWLGNNYAQPWEPDYPGRLPRVSSVGRVMILTPPPSARQISILGSEYRFSYNALYALSDDVDETTVPDSLRDVLLLRAQAEACKELAIRGIAKPVALRDGVSSAPKNGTPSALYQVLLAEFNERMKS